MNSVKLTFNSRLLVNKLSMNFCFSVRRVRRWNQEGFGRGNCPDAGTNFLKK